MCLVGRFRPCASVHVHAHRILGKNPRDDVKGAHQPRGKLHPLIVWCPNSYSTYMGFRSEYEPFFKWIWENFKAWVSWCRRYWVFAGALVLLSLWSLSWSWPDPKRSHFPDIFTNPLPRPPPIPPTERNEANDHEAMLGWLTFSDDEKREFLEGENGESVREFLAYYRRTYLKLPHHE